MFSVIHSMIGSIFTSLLCSSTISCRRAMSTRLSGESSTGVLSFVHRRTTRSGLFISLGIIKPSFFFASCSFDSTRSQCGQDVLWHGRRDKASAFKCSLLALCWTQKLYCWIFSNHLANCPSGNLKLTSQRSEESSVRIMNCLP